MDYKENKFVDWKEKYYQLQSQNEALQKEVIIQKQKQAACVTEMKKLKVEIKAWEDQDGIAKDAAEEEIERLQKENEKLKFALNYLMDGVNGLPPLSAIAGTLIHHFKVAKEALNNNV